MRIFLSLAMILSFSTIAQESTEYKYEVEANKAEYYIGSYKSGKDVNDLVAWYGKFDKWTQTKGDTFDKMSVAILTPYFSSELSTHDVMWVTNTPGPLEQFKGLQEWVTDGMPKLGKSLPVVNTRVIDTWQWVVSNPATTEEGTLMYATYAECSLDEGYNMRKVYDMYKDFAAYAQSQGDTLGRKLIAVDSGAQLSEGVDFIRLMYSSSVAERGTNAQLYYDKIEGSEASNNLTGFSCSNAESYIGQSMRDYK
tara:strand:- start:740 stop:1498 length:759 start_codon:yes stop_codon:yes gene_type:complete